MSTQDQTNTNSVWVEQAIIVLGLFLVIVGMANNLPNIPGLLEFVQSIPGLGWVPRLSKYDPDYFFPLSFALLLTIAMLNASFGRDWKQAGGLKSRLGYALDAVMFLTIISVALVYLIENDQVCLVDVISGERQRLFLEAQSRVQEYIEIFGVAPAEDPPDCQGRLGIWIVPFLIFSVAMFFVYNIKQWGLPIVIVAIAIAVYAVLSSAAWYFDLSTNKYLITVSGTTTDGVRNLNAALSGARNSIILNGSGLLGQFLNITMNTVFPYVVLGSLFGASAGGISLIKLAIVGTRKLRGGPAHAAIVGSAFFGTISGGPVVNVLGTGTLTIPMMIKSGFKRTFAGGVEAAASSGGQVMPPVMGVAAFVLAALSTVPYSMVIIAAFLPAVAYFFSVFLVVVFEARRMDIQPIKEITEEQKLNKDDWVNLLMIVGPILVILVLLLTSKDNVATGPVAFLLGYDHVAGGQMPWLLQLYQNSAGDPDSAGFWGVIMLIVLLFLDRGIRKNPHRVLLALADAGRTIGSLFLLLTAVAVIDIALSYTSITSILTIDILNWVKSASHFTIFGHEFVIGGALYLLLALLMAMVATMLLGMGMPTLPAYVNVVLIIGPLLAALGTSNFAAHMFVFYFAVASAITPPVAIAAFAASTISKADPVATSISSVRIGIVMFIIPFVFAFYPELLLIEPAQVMQSIDGNLSAAKSYLPGYDGTLHWDQLAWLLGRLLVCLYLVASALSFFDRTKLNTLEVWFRLILAGTIMLKDPMVSSIALGIAIVWLLVHWLGLPGAVLRKKNAN